MPCELNSRSSHGIFLNTRTKTKSSCRTLPLIPACEQMLKKMQKEQALNRKVCGKDYCTDYLDYIYVNPMGRRIRPNFLSQHFPDFLVAHQMKRIRFHDLRHSCASLLYVNGVSLKEIRSGWGTAISAPPAISIPIWIFPARSPRRMQSSISSQKTPKNKKLSRKRKTAQNLSILSCFMMECRWWDSNPHGFPSDFESLASAIPPHRRIAFERLLLYRILWVKSRGSFAPFLKSSRPAQNT